MDDDVRGPRQGFLLAGPERRKGTFQTKRERDERRSAERCAEGGARLLTARTPPGVADLPDFERSSSELSVGLKTEDKSGSGSRRMKGGEKTKIHLYKRKREAVGRKCDYFPNH